jgi:microtubule-associated protein, RP/EB family
MANENFGMMDGAFFVSKSELLAWVNSLLNLAISRIEQLASAAAYCQIMDAMYPGCISLSKVNWSAKYEHEFINNYKLLQQAFIRCKVQKHIEVEKLIKGRYQDNLEFLQWFKRFFDLNCRGVTGYNALERRRGSKTPWDRDENSADSSVNSTNRVNGSLQQAKSLLSQKEPLSDSTNASKNIASERDCFYEKLKNIELYCGLFSDQDNFIIENIQKILLATNCEEVKVNRDGTVTVSFKKSC